MTHLLLLLSMLCSFNQAGDFESFICHTDELRREPRYVGETAVCYGLTKLRLKNSPPKIKLSSENKELLENFLKQHVQKAILMQSEYNLNKLKLRTSNPLTIQKNPIHSPSSPYVATSDLAKISDEDLKKQIDIQMSLRNSQ